MYEYRYIKGLKIPVGARIPVEFAVPGPKPDVEKKSFWPITRSALLPVAEFAFRQGIAPVAEGAFRELHDVALVN